MRAIDTNPWPPNGVKFGPFLGGIWQYISRTLKSL